MKRSLRCCTALVAAAAMCACSHRNANVTTQSASTTSSSGSIVAAAGTEFTGKLREAVGTKTGTDGQPFQIAETHSMSSALDGSVLEGHLAGVQPAGPMRPAKMTLVFDDLRLADGSKVPVSVEILSSKAFDPATHHWRTAGMMLGGAIAGHELAKHARVHHGALAGALGGYALSQELKTDVDVPAGSVITVRFTAPVRAGAAGAGY
ncbi:MAG TPA: hypothetical protein VMH02_01255 [Verrucomicrobiae bacterium]|nr:hypothetical protein [Verrucomicrobiae bacterium]